MDTSDDPITMAILGGLSTAAKMVSIRQQGKNMEAIGEARAQADRMSAEAERRHGEERSRSMAKKGKRFVAGQRASFAARNIRVESGVAEAVTGASKEAILRDINAARGESEARAQRFEHSAAMELAQGKMFREQSRWDMLNAGLSGGFQIANLGYDAGWWGGDPNVLYDLDED